MQQENHKLLRAFAMATNAPLEPGVIILTGLLCFIEAYTQIAEIDTALCLQKLEESQTGVALPRNIYTRVYSSR